MFSTTCDERVLCVQRVFETSDSAHFPLRLRLLLVERRGEINCMTFEICMLMISDIGCSVISAMSVVLK